MTNSKNTITTKSKSELITTSQADTICEKLTKGLTLTEILEEKQYQFSLMKFYHFLKKNPDFSQSLDPDPDFLQRFVSGSETQECTLPEFCF